MISRILDYIGYRCINMAASLDNRHAYPTMEALRYKLEDPHELKRVTYPLWRNSLVIDVGGLTGDWAARMYCRYSCKIDIYEPHPALRQQAIMNFCDNRKVSVFSFGLGKVTGTMNLYGDSVGASLIRNSLEPTPVEIVKASDWFNKAYSEATIDLLKLNVEGAEYDILDDLIAGYDMRRIKNLQIQFHQNVPGYEERRDTIRDGLAREGFVMTWCYDYIFENWELMHNGC
jgi:FkbM family methyltransferase